MHHGAIAIVNGQPPPICRRRDRQGTPGHSWIGWLDPDGKISLLADDPGLTPWNGDRERADLSMPGDVDLADGDGLHCRFGHLRPPLTCVDLSVNSRASKVSYRSTAGRR